MKALKRSQTSKFDLPPIDSSSSSSSRYPYPSEVNVEDFVTIKLSATNYFIWKSMMLSLIKSHGLAGFINGNIPPPPERIDVPNENDDSSINGSMIENQDYQDWKRSDGLLRRWILATLNEDLLIRVVRLQTAKEMWTMLERGSQTFLDEEEMGQNLPVREDLSRYLPLYRAALNGDWEVARRFLDLDPYAIRAVITGVSETALMVAVRSVRRNHFVKQIMQMMAPYDLAVADHFGSTALHIAAIAGNTEAAKLLVKMNPVLPNVRDNSNSLPLHIAAVRGKKEMVLYLLIVTNEDAYLNPFGDEHGVTLLHSLIASGLYDIALHIVQRYPKLAIGDPSPVQLIAHKRSAFKSGVRLNFLQDLIYSYVPVEETYHYGRLDIENPADNFTLVRRKLHGLIWNCTEILVPQIKHMRDLKSNHQQALQLLKCLCSEISRLDYSKALLLLEGPLKIATQFGVHEVVEEILCSHPGVIYVRNKKNQTIFHLAIFYRRENVFNIIYQVEGLGHTFLSAPDIWSNNGLDLAVCLGYQQELNLRASAAGAALQMQRELQWFKEVEKFTLTQDREKLNSEGKTPAMVFSETHQELVKQGEEWMKDTANSCTIVAALIVTVVFATAITVPGGNNSNTGLPFFATRRAFVIFAISDALALFSSTTSVLMFLSILTSRYAEHDFLSALPKRLIIGLVTLFLSILFMMIAFVASLKILFGDNRSWILVPVVALACVPVTSFMSLQFPLLLDMVRSTYGSGIFGKQSDRIIY